ncbi:hypothetical protein C4552_02895 [Candidatus Parcubacteria bacterium]|nr:MAG: hypothetical protein C4552_02895 [Candidatus Parcubacteria bacterium]
MTIKSSVNRILHPFHYEMRKAEPHDARYNLPFTRGNVDRLLYFHRMFERIENVPGAIVEMGVGKAKSFQMITLLALAHQRPEVIWGFDSFEGYPEVSPEDESPRNRKKGQWKIIRADEVRPILLRAGVPAEYYDARVRIVPGFFEDVLASVIEEMGPIAYLHLDVNLYAAYKLCLDQLFPHVAPGGIILFDEYARGNEAVKCPGAKKAIDEFFANTPWRPQADSRYGKYFLVKTPS